MVKLSDNFSKILKDGNKQENLEDILKESEEIFRIITEQSLMGIFFFFKDKIIYVNQKVVEILGYQHKDFYSWKIEDLMKIIHPLDKSIIIDQVKNLGDLTQDNYHLRVFNKDKKLVWLDIFVKAFPFRGETGILISFIDITAKKKVEINLKKSMEKHDNLVHNILDAIIEIEPNGKITYFSHQVFDIFGFKPEELIGTKVFHHIHPDDLMYCLEALKQVLKMGEPLLINFRGKHKNGNYIHVSAKGTLVKRKNEIKIVGVVRDMTDQMVYAKALEESEQRFRNITEQSLMGIAIYQDHQIKYANHASIQISGYSIEEILNWKGQQVFLRLVHPEDLANVEKSKRFISYRMITKSGRIKWIDQYQKKILYEGKNAILITFLDISEKMEAIKLIKEENEKLLELNKMRSEIITRTSHELKTPLISIYGASQMLLNSYKNEVSNEAYEFIKMVNKGGERLRTLVFNLLDASKIESGRMVIKLKKENIVEIIKNCVEEVIFLINKKEFILKINLPEKLYLNIDKIRINQVLTNILSNAIKNTPNGGIISVDLKEYDKWIDISITDSGIGLKKEEMGKLFKKFGKIERMIPEPNIDHEGSGLGLAISKEIVEGHMGKIWAESEGRNKGAKFTVRLFTRLTG